MFLITLAVAMVMGFLAFLFCRLLKLNSTLSIAIGAIFGMVLLIGWEVFVQINGDILFYESIGYSEFFWLRLKYYWSIFGISSIVYLLFLLVNSFLADWLIPVKLDIEYHLLIKGILVLMAILFGWINAGAWDEYLLYINATQTGVLDPIYGRDISFYLFTLPILKKGVTMILLATFGAVIASAITYGLQYILYSRMKERGNYNEGTKGIELIEKVAIRHAGILAGLAIASLAVWWWLKSIMVPLGGTTYMEVNYTYYVFLISAVISVILGIVVVISAFRRSTRGMLWAVGLKVGIVFFLFLLGGIRHLIFISPQELSYEEPYLQINLDSTKEAFMVGPDHLQEVEFASVGLDRETIEELPDSVIDSIRLLDYEYVALPTFDATEEESVYYDFLDTDMVLATTEVDGPIQIMSAPRELPKGEVPRKNFINERLTYVCSMGSVSVYVSKFNPNGSLIYLASELPMEGDENLIPENEVTCYGESEDLSWVVTNTDVEAAGVPLEDGGFEEFEYTGTGGIEIGSGMRRFLLASYVGSFKLYTSNQVHSTSRLHVVRNIVERLEKVLPTGWIDHDPYMVAAAGVDDFVWITDVATHSNLYPFSVGTSTQMGEGLLETSVSYVRPSIKATVNAYTGDLQLFIVEDDPIAQTWAKIFPNLFSTQPALPSIAEYFRYPEEVFVLQSEVLEEFHVSSASVLYNGSNIWSIWKERLGYETAEVTAPRYVYTLLPGEKTPSYVLEWGFNRLDKEQAKAQLVARIGEDGYELMLYIYQNSSAIGPVQFEGKIDKYNRPGLELNSLISDAERNETLIRGNLIALPVGQSQLYIKPLYLRDSDTQQEGGLPALWKVAVGTTDDQLEIGIGSSLDEALNNFVVVNFGERETEEAVSTTPIELPQGTFIGSELFEVEGPEVCQDGDDCSGTEKSTTTICTPLWNNLKIAVAKEDPVEIGRIAFELLGAGCD